MLINPLYEKFVAAYVGPARFNATEAYVITYGCTRASAQVGGCRLKKRPEVAREINRRFKAQLAAIEGDIQETARSAFSDLMRR